MTEATRLARSLTGQIDDLRVLAAIASVPRHRFLGPEQRSQAYENVALPIACGQTISQPLVVARMLELLKVEPQDRVLDIGTGSGYHAALLALLAGHVWTVERQPSLSGAARDVVAALGLADRITFVVGDGRVGLPEHAPFDAINVAAASERPVAELEEQLAPGGRLIAPLGHREQRLVRVRRVPTGLERTVLEPVRFVPLTG